MSGVRTGGASPVLIKTRKARGSAFYHRVVPPTLHTCCASDVSFDRGQSTRLCLGQFTLVGVSRFSRVALPRRKFLGRVLRGPIIGLQGPRNHSMLRLRQCTSFVNADGRGSLLASPSKDHHIVYVRIAKGVSAARPVSCRRLCTRTVRRVRRNRHC